TASSVARLIDAGEPHTRLQSSSILILDVGTSLEFEAAHVPGARWISRGWIELKLPERFPDRGQSIMTCPDGRNSVFAALALTKLGYTDVFVLDGGVQAWLATGYPTGK